MKLKILKLTASAIIPQYQHSGDSGLALYSTNEQILLPGEAKLIPTGIAIELPIGFEAQIRPRSGLALKHSITVLNTPGTVDASYRGEIGVILINHGHSPFPVSQGMRIAQMVIAPVIHAEIDRGTPVSAGSVVLRRSNADPVTQLSPTTRGNAGFGSTGSTP